MAIDSTSTTFNHRYACCCLQITRPDSNSGSKWWRSISQNENKWWTKGVRVIIHFRQWSEVIAGPKWKTFIRRFNRNRSGNGGGGLGVGGVTFNYDPLSYSLNFDEGQGQNGQFDEDEYYGGTRDFSARYAAVPKDGS